MSWVFMYSALSFPFIACSDKDFQFKDYSSKNCFFLLNMRRHKITVPFVPVLRVHFTQSFTQRCVHILDKEDCDIGVRAH